MTRTHLLRLATLAALGPLLGARALAQDDSYFYGGLAAGRARAKIDEPRITSTLLAAGLTGTGFTRDESDRTFRVFGGRQFNRYFGVEAGYFDLGKFGFTASTQPTGSLNGQIKLKGLNLDLVGTLPVSERFSLIGRVGAQAARAQDTFSGTGAVIVTNPNVTKTEVNVKFGGGVQYEVSRNFLIRGEAEHYRVNDALGNHGGVNTVTVSVVVPFGRTQASLPRAAAPAPAPYLAPPRAEVQAPPPVVVAPPAPPAPPAPLAMAAPERRRVSFSAESLFGFDRADITPAGKSALDKFAADAQGARLDTVTVEGHTDRIGSAAYNQKLSQKRAEAVKAYFVSAGGFDAGRVNAVGKGESSPVTQAGACKGERANSKLIACLQADRRVVIEVSGTR